MGQSKEAEERRRWAAATPLAHTAFASQPKTPELIHEPNRAGPFLRSSRQAKPTFLSEPLPEPSYKPPVEPSTSLRLERE